MRLLNNVIPRDKARSELESMFADNTLMIDVLAKVQNHDIQVVWCLMNGHYMAEFSQYEQLGNGITYEKNIRANINRLRSYDARSYESCAFLPIRINKEENNASVYSIDEADIEALHSNPAKILSRTRKQAMARASTTTNKSIRHLTRKHGRDGAIRRVVKLLRPDALGGVTKLLKKKV